MFNSFNVGRMLVIDDPPASPTCSGGALLPAGAAAAAGMAKAAMTPAMSALMPPLSRQNHSAAPSPPYTNMLVTLLLHATVRAAIVAAV